MRAPLTRTEKSPRRPYATISEDGAAPGAAGEVAGSDPETVTLRVSWTIPPLASATLTTILYVPFGEGEQEIVEPSTGRQVRGRPA
jgi:hypothetical protein